MRALPAETTFHDGRPVLVINRDNGRLTVMSLDRPVTHYGRTAYPIREIDLGDAGRRSSWLASILSIIGITTTARTRTKAPATGEVLR